MNKKYPLMSFQLSVLVAALLTTLALPASGLQFSPDEKARLKAGETVIRELPTSGQKGFFGGSGYALIDAPVQAVWKTLLNWDNYPDMFPYTAECAPLSRKGNRTLIKMVTGHPVVTVQYHLSVEAKEADKTLQFELVSNYPHDLSMIKGFWRLFPQPGNRTLLAYVVSTKAPAGLVAIVGPKLAQDAIEMMLSIPGDVRKWMASH